MAPPSPAAELPLIVLFLTVTMELAPWIRLSAAPKIPPPLAFAELPLIVLLLTVSVASPSAPAVKIPPPLPVVELPLTVLLVIVSVVMRLKASLSMPPPTLLTTLLSLRVSLERLTMPPVGDREARNRSVRREIMKHDERGVAVDRQIFSTRTVDGYAVGNLKFAAG